MLIGKPGVEREEDDDADSEPEDKFYRIRIKCSQESDFFGLVSYIKRKLEAECSKSQT